MFGEEHGSAFNRIRREGPLKAIMEDYQVRVIKYAPRQRGPRFGDMKEALRNAGGIHTPGTAYVNYDMNGNAWPGDKRGWRDR